MEHSFNVQFAQKYGIEEAIIVHNFYFWLRKNIANEKHLHNGRYWTYNSNNAFTKLFPYINKTKIFRVLKHLEEEGLLIKGCFNQDARDRTLWYAFSDNGIETLKSFGYDMVDFKMTNCIVQNEICTVQNEPTIPYIKHTDNKQEEKEDNKLSSQKKFNFKQALLDLGIAENIANDFLLVRKNKKATNSETAFNRIKSEIEKSGLSANDCITIAVENSWQGFKSEWVNKTKTQGKTDFFRGYTPQKISDRADDYLRTLKVDIKFEQDGVKYLKDDTFISNGKRYYRNKFGSLVEVPIGLVARPNENWEYNKNNMAWVQDERTMTTNDFMF